MDTAQTPDQAPLSFDALNLNKACETALPFFPVAPNGNTYGIKLMVIGGHSAKVKGFVHAAINAERAKQALAAKYSRKKVDSYTPIETDLEFGAEAVAVRIVGWDGIARPYSPEAAVELCTINAEISRQVRDFSEDMGNFTKG